MHIHEKLEIREWLLRSREIDEKKKEFFSKFQGFNDAFVFARREEKVYDEKFA